MARMCSAAVFFIIMAIFLTETKADDVDPSKCQVYGPGLISHIVLPARYFLIETHDAAGKRLINKSFIIFAEKNNILYSCKGSTLRLKENLT